jgi:hypothetical protein
VRDPINELYRAGVAPRSQNAAGVVFRVVRTGNDPFAAQFDVPGVAVAVRVAMQDGADLKRALG